MRAPTGTAMRRLVHVLLVLFIAWRGVVAAIGLGAEARSVHPDELRDAVTLDEDARIARELARWEKKGRVPVGREIVLYHALKKHVPPGDTVYFVAGREMKPALAFTHAFVLLYPRRFFAVPRVPPDWRTLLHCAPDVWLLELDQPPTPELADRFELVAAGDDFRLWHCKGGV